MKQFHKLFIPLQWNEERNPRAKENLKKEDKAVLVSGNVFFVF
jgi:hypothetical protein